jgi:hypothetical protein
MKIFFLFLIFGFLVQCEAQNWHLNTEPVYFFINSPNIALDYNINSSLALGFQYAALNWANNGNNLSGFQLFYSRTSHINSNSEILKLYVGLLSPNTKLLKIETKDHAFPLYDILYGYRWVMDGKFTIAVLAGTFFTSTNIYPSISIPVGYLF